jgi:uncharacterized protein
MNSYAIPTEKVLERLRFENPWWKTGAIDPDVRDMPRRLYFDLFYPVVSNIELRRAVILMGPRRVGKTVMMHHAVHRLMGRWCRPTEHPFHRH